MKNSLSLALLALLLVFPLFISGQTAAPGSLKDYYPVIDYDYFKSEYTVKQGDKFLIQIMGLETRELIAPVTISGQIILYPISKPILVAGLTLNDAESKILEKLTDVFIDTTIEISLISISPQSFHVVGAVNRPGQHVADSLLTLHQSLILAGGLSPAASRKITLTRRGESRVFDLNRYLMHGDKSHNPFVFSDDLIRATFADDYAKVYVVTDSVNYVEYFEIDEPTEVLVLLKGISEKYPLSDYSSIKVKRNNKTTYVEKNFLVNNGDHIYIHPEESYVFVRGNVNSPGKVNFFSGKSPQYYISAAGGINRVGTNNRIHIIDRHGEKFRYRGQEINEGDTIVIPLSTRTLLTDYLTPISAMLSLITTIVVLTR
jgi:protein involved in polysaccharide export with SLBB domain